MLSPFNLLLITASFSVVMLFVLWSLCRSGIPGVKEWSVANALAFVALLLYAARGVAPTFLSIEVANGMLASAIAVIYIGFRRFFSRSVPGVALAIGIILVVLVVAVFHYGYDSIALRTVTVSIFHGAVCFAIGLTIFQSPRSARSRYPHLFTGVAAMLLALGHGIRGLVYGLSADVLTSTFQASPWNLLFLSVGTLVLPVMTMGAVMMVHDAMMTKAEDMANRDFLTGAWSRRAFFELAEREILRASRTGRALSLLVFDVDYFKTINDTYGHAAGDQVLVDIASRATRQIRGVDYFARVGGEEFAVLLPEASEASALRVGERLRAALQREASGGSSSANAGPVAAYTVSIGVATLRESESFPGLMRRADSALYEAKASGRNAVMSAADFLRMEDASS